MTGLWNVIDVVCVFTRHSTENAERDSEQNDRDDNKIRQREIGLENERGVVTQRFWKKFFPQERIDEKRHATVIRDFSPEDIVDFILYIYRLSWTTRIWKRDALDSAWPTW